MCYYAQAGRYASLPKMTFGKLAKFLLGEQGGNSIYQTES